MVAADDSPLGALFKLPLEIREIIYSYLSPRARLPTVLRSRHLGVSSVSHRPPPVDALLACRQLYAEALDVYYRKCVFKFDGLLDPANIWPLWQIEEVLGASELGRATLAQMRKIELNLFWHRLPDGGVQMDDMGGTYGSLAITEGDKRQERLDRAMQVLQRAVQLKSVVLTWKEVPHRKEEEPQQDWTLKEKVLQSFVVLSGVRLIAGDIVASEEVEKSILDMIKDTNAKTTVKPRFRKRLESRAYLDLVEVADGAKPTQSNNKKRRSYFG